MSWVGDNLNNAIRRQMLATNAVYRRMVMGDAPYCFWLGAQAEPDLSRVPGDIVQLRVPD